jgi:immune inhibitor A
MNPPRSKRARILTDTPLPVKLAVGLLLLALPGGAAAVPTRGDLRLLVLLAGFPDRALARPPSDFAGRPDALVDRMAAYWTEVSAGRLRIVPHLGAPVVTVPEPRTRYVQRPDALAGDALRAFAAAPLAAADREALAAADAVVVFFAGAGRESHLAPGGPPDPWSNFTSLAPAVHGFDAACVIAEQALPPLATFGVLCHEFGHLLGLPELYAPGGRAHEGIGVWGLMGQGTWVGRGDAPPHLEAWSKMRLGWVDVETIAGDARGVELPAVETTPRAVRIPLRPDTPEEYLLLENRQRIGADARLPGAGILVWHVDERVQGFRSAQLEPTRKLLHLVEADGRGDLDRGHAAGGNRGDAGDPWIGPPRWQRRLAAGLALAGALLVAAALLRLARPRALVPVAIRLAVAAGALVLALRLGRSPVCGPATPGMAPHDGGIAPVILRNFSPSGPVMRFDVLRLPAAGAP